MPEFVVSATRWQVNVQQLPFSATVLTSADLLGTNGNTLGSALEGVPGLFLKSYGGPGSVSTTSMRGMGAEHTLVLVDGQRYNNVRDGQVDFGVFLLQNIDRVEVLRGGFSSLYGAEVAAGSYGMNGFQVSSDFDLLGIGLQVAAQREVGGGNFEFMFNDGISSNILRRQNSDYALNQIQLRADVPLLPEVSLRVSSMVDWSDRGSPGAVLAQTSGNKARLRDNGSLTQATFEWTVQPTLLVRLSSLFHAQRREYKDPLSGGGIDNGQAVYSDRTVTLTPHLRYVLHSSSSVNLGAEYSHSSISGSEIAGADRNQESLFLSSDHVIEFSRSFFYQINVFPSIRYDHLASISDSCGQKESGSRQATERASGRRPLMTSIGRMAETLLSGPNDLSASTQEWFFLTTCSVRSNSKRAILTSVQTTASCGARTGVDSGLPKTCGRAVSSSSLPGVCSMIICSCGRHTAIRIHARRAPDPWMIRLWRGSSPTYRMRSPVSRVQSILGVPHSMCIIRSQASASPPRRTTRVSFSRATARPTRTSLCGLRNNLSVPICDSKSRTFSIQTTSSFRIFPCP
jgi:hypothetical protein